MTELRLKLRYVQSQNYFPVAYIAHQCGLGGLRGFIKEDEFELNCLFLLPVLFYFNFKALCLWSGKALSIICYRMWQNDPITISV